MDGGGAVRQVFRNGRLHLRCLPQVSVYVSFYVEATNRDAYMAIKQDLLLAFIDCVERNGAKLAKQLLQVRSHAKQKDLHLR